MPVYNEVHQMLEAAQQHVHETRHSVYCCDDPMMRLVGFACSDCTNLDTIWSVGLRAIFNLSTDDPLRARFGTPAGRNLIADDLNREALETPPVSYSHLESVREEFLSSTTPIEDEVQQLEELWDADGASRGLEELARRTTKAKEDFEEQVHSRVPTRFEREDVI